ncbi:MAG: hypothetical protein ABEJ77_03245 [Halanaeroarchaeum sp.]
MDRRTYLASLGTAGAAAVAGFAGVGTTTLDDPTVRHEGDEVHLLYRRDGDRIAAISVQYGPVAGGPPYRMRLSLWHAGETRVSDLGLLLWNRDATAPPPAIYLAAPAGNLPSVDFRRGEDRARGFFVPDLGEGGSGTVTLEWYLRPYEDPPIGLWIETEASLATGRLGRYALEGTAAVTIEGPRSRA